MNSINRLYDLIESTYQSQPTQVYDDYNIKRGLRNPDGTPVMAGITAIGDVRGYYMQDGERIAVDGKLKYQMCIRDSHYHSDLTEGHPYASPWWQWPLMVKPIFYYQQDFGNGIRAGMSSFGNPTVWWGGLVAFVMCIFYACLLYTSRCV